MDKGTEVPGVAGWLQAQLEFVMLLVLSLAVLLLMGAGLALSWFLFLPLRLLEAGLKRAVRHG